MVIRSPRFLRPHTITIRNRIGESDVGEELFSEATIDHVKFDGTFGVTQSTRGLTNTDTVVVTIDMHDYDSDKTYTQASDFDPDTEFVIRNDDQIVYQEDTYTINQVKVISPRGNDPDFIEVYAA